MEIVHSFNTLRCSSGQQLGNRFGKFLRGLRSACGNDISNNFDRIAGLNRALPFQNVFDDRKTGGAFSLQEAGIGKNHHGITAGAHNFFKSIGPPGQIVNRLITPELLAAAAANQKQCLKISGCRIVNGDLRFCQRPCLWRWQGTRKRQRCARPIH